MQDILAACYERECTGKGRLVECSLLETEIPPEDRREQDAHGDDARRQKLHIIAATGAGEGRAKPVTLSRYGKGAPEG